MESDFAAGYRAVVLVGYTVVARYIPDAVHMVAVAVVAGIDLALVADRAVASAAAHRAVDRMVVAHKAWMLDRFHHIQQDARFHLVRDRQKKNQTQKPATRSYLGKENQEHVLRFCRMNGKA